MRWACVVPSNRQERLGRFRQAWANLFLIHNVHVIVVKDEPPWDGIPDFIPKRTDAIRSWGFYQAWLRGAEFTISLDDDVKPTSDVFQAYEDGFRREWPCSPYLSVGSLTTSALEMRGYPYQGRNSECAVQFGGWDGVLDYDAVTQISHSPTSEFFSPNVVPVPRGTPVTCCAMNFAFRTKHTPLMWQLPLHECRYNRFGDIWAGLFMKRVLDAQGRVMVVNGKAKVHHERASDPYANLEREAPGMGLNERLWDALPESSDYREVTDAAARLLPDDYSAWFLHCREQWLGLFGGT